MMIAPGTLCILIDPHPMRSKSCTVLGLVPLGNVVYWGNRGQEIMTPGREIYSIEIPGQPPARNFHWCATRPQLLPIAPPQRQLTVTVEADFGGLREALDEYRDKVLRSMEKALNTVRESYARPGKR